MTKNSKILKRKLYKNIFIGSFYFFLIKGIIWLIIIVGAALGLDKFL